MYNNSMYERYVLDDNTVCNAQRTCSRAADARARDMARAGRPPPPYTTLYCTILHYTILYYTILYYTILYYTIISNAIPFYFILSYHIVL